MRLSFFARAVEEISQAAQRWRWPASGFAGICRQRSRTGAFLGVPQVPQMGKFEQEWVNRNGDADAYPGALSLDASTTCAENTGFKVGSSGRTRTYNPSVNSRRNLVAVVLQTKGLQAQFSNFAGNWGRFGGGRVALWLPMYG